MATRRVVLICTGSVATIKVPMLCRALLHECGANSELAVVATPSAIHFLTTADCIVRRNRFGEGGDGGGASWHMCSSLPVPASGVLLASPPHEDDDGATVVEKGVPIAVPLYQDSDEWSMWSGRGDPVLHIELKKFADVIVVAPLDANTLAKVVHGICDNLATCVLRATDVSSTPIVIAPAMNHDMWRHPLTAQQLTTAATFMTKLSVVEPVEKRLMCGDVGVGAMASVDDIAKSVAACFVSCK